MSFLGDWMQSRRARYQAAALKSSAEAALHDRRRLLASKPHKTPTEVMEQSLLEASGVGMLGGWGDQVEVLKDYLTNFQSLNGWGSPGGGITTKRGRRGGDYPFITSEAHYLSHIDFSRLVWPNPNIQGLHGGRRRYTLGSGATIRVMPRDDSSGSKEAARIGQAFIDGFLKENQFAFEQRTFFDRGGRDGEGIWRLFPQEDGNTIVRNVYGEQLRCPPGELQQVYEYGIKTPADDVQTIEEYAVWSLDQADNEPDRVPPEEIIYYAPNRESGVKRSLPDWTLTTGEIAELADDLGNSIGEGSKLQSSIAYIMQHTNVPAETIRARGFADESYEKTDPWSGQKVPVKKMLPGTIVETNQNTQFLGSPFNAGISAHAEIFQMLMQRVSARWNAPKWLATSNNDDVNFASSLTTSAPFVLSTLEAQEVVAEPFRTMCERALSVRAIAGRLPENILDLVEVKVTLPSPVARDRDKDAQRANIQLANGTLSPQEACEEDGREWKKVQADRKEAMAQGWTPPSQGPAAKEPGMGGGGKPPGTVSESKDSTGHEHKGKGKGGGQFTSGSGGGGSENTPQAYRDLIAKAKDVRKSAHKEAVDKAREHHEASHKARDESWEAISKLNWDTDNEDNGIGELESLIQDYDPAWSLQERSDFFKEVGTAAKNALDSVDDAKETEGLTDVEAAENKTRLAGVIALAKQGREHIKAHADARREAARIKSGEWLKEYAAAIGFDIDAAVIEQMEGPAPQ